jgi:hypothetical protein
MRVANSCRFWRLSTAVVAAALAVGLVGTSLAQDATPAAMDGGEGLGPLVTDLHQGGCDELSAEPVQRLADLQFPEWVTAMASGDESDLESVAIAAEDFGNPPVPVAFATTEVPISLADIVSARHAIEIATSDSEDPADSVACGNIGGIPDENGDLFVGIEPLNDSGHTGVAWLHDNGTSTTFVVLLAHPEEREAIEASLAGLLAASIAEGEDMEATPAAPAATPAVEADATPVT